MTPDSPPNPPPREVTIVANPYSGALENRARVEALVEALRREGLQPRALWSFDELSEAAGEPGFLERCRCVVAAGGDGTFNRLLNCRFGAPLAMFPLGNENLLARQFGYPAEPSAAAAALAAGRLCTIDAARAGPRLFSIVASAGFDAEVVHRLERWRSAAGRLKRVRRGSYVPLIVGAAWQYGFPLLEIEADELRCRGALVLVFNLPQYCFGLPFVPSARGDDQWLDFVVFTRPGRWATIGYALSVLRRRHAGRGDVVVGRARCIRLQGSQAVPLEIDGEAHGFTPVEIEVVPAALPLLVPPEC